MTKLSASLAGKSAPSVPTCSVLQRKCACGSHTGGEPCKGCRTRGRVQRKSAVAAPAYGVPAEVRTVIGSAGQPLGDGVRSLMEQHFGHDFSAVRVHDDARAGRSAQQVSALAYTVGDHMAFAPGRYAPESLAGRHLLAHELTHVVQQSSPERASGSVSRDEAEADRSADAAVAGRSVPPISAAPPAFRKQEAPTATDAAQDVVKAESSCDLPVLCRLYFAHPQVVDDARIVAAYRLCAPRILAAGTPGLNPCFSLASLPSGSLGPRATPNAVSLTPTAPGAGSSAPGGLQLPSTKLSFHLGKVQLQLDLPSSFTATLPVSYHGAEVVTFELEAKPSGDFSFTVKINAAPHVRISLKAGVSVGDHPQASAGLTIEAADKVCRAQDPLAAKDALTKAGQQLHDAIQAAQASPQPEKLKDVVAAIVDVQQAIDGAQSKCKQVPRARLDLGAHFPIGGDTPHAPPTAGDPGLAPYFGGTLTIPF